MLILSRFPQFIADFHSLLLFSIQSEALPHSMEFENITFLFKYEITLTMSFSLHLEKHSNCIMYANAWSSSSMANVTFFNSVSFENLILTCICKYHLLKIDGELVGITDMFESTPLIVELCGGLISRWRCLSYISF